MRSTKSFYEYLVIFGLWISIATIYLFVDKSETLIYSKLAILGFIACTIPYLIKKKTLYLHEFIIMLSLFVSYTGFSIIWAEDRSLAITRFLTIVQLFILAIVIYHIFYIKRETDVILKSLLFAGICLCIYVFMKYSIFEIFGFLASSGRLGSKIANENLIGRNLSVTVIICVYYFFIRKKLTVSLAMITSFLLLIATKSRASLFVLIVGIFLILYYTIGTRNKIKFGLILTLICLTVITVGQQSWAESIYNRVIAGIASFITKNTLDASVSIRWNLIKEGIEQFFNKPILGYGVGTSFVMVNTNYHNNYIQLLVECGIVGFLLYYSMYAFILAKLYKYIKKNVEALVIFTLIVMNLVYDFSTPSYYDKLTYVYLVLGFLFIRINRNKVKVNISSRKECRNEVNVKVPKRNDLKCVRIGQFINGLGNGGIETLVKSWYKNIDRNKVQFDFIIHYKENSPDIHEIETMGGRVIPLLQNRKSVRLIDYVCKFTTFYKLLKKEQYTVIHFHASFHLTFFYCLIAYLAGTKKIVMHSHTSDFDKKTGWLRKFFSIIFSKLFTGICTKRYACSLKAGEWMYGSKPAEVIKNGINVSDFRFDEEIRQAYRNKLGISDKFVIGHVGRIEYAKNHAFLIDIFNEIRKVHSNSVLLIVGTGSLEGEIRKKVNILGLSDSVIFYGLSNKVARLMQAMDLLILPSHYEGLGIVTIEAQAAALKVIASDAIPTETAITDYISYCSLKEPAKRWADMALRFKTGYTREDITEKVYKAGYDIREVTQSLMEYYISSDN